jgi:hypothetical protein
VRSFVATSSVAVDVPREVFMKRGLPLLLAVACALGACASPPPPPRREVIAVRVTQAPPPPRVEVVPAPPASHFYWVGGHWKWEGGYVWEPGRWVEPRVDQAYVQASWAHRGNEWIYRPAHWHTARNNPGVVVVTAPSAPPPPRIETITPPPGAEFIWIAGHWRLEHGQYEWSAGHWERRRAGEHWLSAHWVQRGPNWAYVAGRWEVD